MTNHERAEKILSFEGSHSENKFFKDFLISQLDEAVREAVDQGPTVLQACQASYREGFAAAREKAAGIAEQATRDQGPGISEWIAERIRSLRPDGEK